MGLNIYHYMYTPFAMKFLFSIDFTKISDHVLEEEITRISSEFNLRTFGHKVHFFLH